MKTTLLTTVLAVVSMGSESQLISQDFNVTRQNLNLEIDLGALWQIKDVYQFKPIFRSGLASFATITETVTINPATGTVRQFGSLNLPELDLPPTTFHAIQTVSVPPIFPNPPTPPTVVAGDLTLSFSIPATSLLFDTGFLGTFWNGEKYEIFGRNIDIAVPFSMNFTLETGGMTYVHTQNSSLHFTLFTGGGIDADNYPSSVELLPFSFSRAEASILSFTAPNGFVASAIVTTVPEPTVIAIVGLAGLALNLLRRKARRD